ncbi:MAG: TatD family hydrolase [Clostridiales bacterium]|nr:TatD family hydrolase [Clostridiales bacterium]
MSEPLQLFDTHCHLDDARFDEDRDQLIASLPGQGVARVLTCGSDLASSRDGLDLARRHEGVFTAAGIHPHEAARAREGDLAAIARLLKEPKVVALGEIGLDFHYDFSPRDTQLELLNAQLDLALEARLPVVLHVREAHGAMLDLLRGRRGRLPGGVLHCYSGSDQSALLYQEMGFYISFAGPITFKNADKLRQAALAVRPERLLIETDSPYLAPVPHRGKRNDPAKVVEVARALAELFNLQLPELARLTWCNANTLFGLPELPAV